MFRRVGLILALMMTSAAADDYRSYREAYAAVDSPIRLRPLSNVSGVSMTS